MMGASALSSAIGSALVSTGVSEVVNRTLHHDSISSSAVTSNIAIKSMSVDSTLLNSVDLMVNCKDVLRLASEVPFLKDALEDLTMALEAVRSVENSGREACDGWWAVDGVPFDDSDMERRLHQSNLHFREKLHSLTLLIPIASFVLEHPK